MSEKQIVSRPAMESIFLWIAREAVEEAEKHEPDIEGSVEAHIQMQHRAITAIITSTMATEAFINVIAEEQLSLTEWRAVEKANLAEKWILVTKLLTDKVWDKGSQPFQDFNRLIKLRNELVHYKPKFVEGNIPFENDFTGKLARQYFSAACGMISGFFEKAGQEVPPSVQPGTLPRGVIEVRQNLYNALQTPD
jgi:hypothetical protein